MNTPQGYRIQSALVCLTVMVALTIGNVNASPTKQAETDFAAIDAYVTEQMNNLGIPGMCRVLALPIHPGGRLHPKPLFTSARSPNRLPRWR